jgi:hypothetical protein
MRPTHGLAARLGAILVILLVAAASLACAREGAAPAGDAAPASAAGIMLLVESGDVSLDDPLTRFLPDYPMQGHTVTVEHLLNHTSGIKSYTGLVRRWQRATRSSTT